MDRYKELETVLHSDEVAKLPVEDWTAKLREYYELKKTKEPHMERRTIANLPRQEWLAHLYGDEGQTAVSELSAGDYDAFNKSHAEEADRLMARLDNEVLTPAQKKEVKDRLRDITDIMTEAYKVQKRQRRGTRLV